MQKKAEESKEQQLNPLESERLTKVFNFLGIPLSILFWIAELSMEEKNKEYDEEAAKLEAKYKIEEDLKKDEKDKKRGERLKKKEKEKAKLRERSNKITEADLMKVLEFLNPREKPKITEVRDMIWVQQTPGN